MARQSPASHKGLGWPHLFDDFQLDQMRFNLQFAATSAPDQLEKSRCKACCGEIKGQKFVYESSIVDYLVWDAFNLTATVSAVK